MANKEMFDDKNRDLSIEEIVEKVKSLVGKQMVDIYATNDFSNKASFGYAIEEGAFNYQRNSKSEADFRSENIELKVTPFRQNKDKTYSAKERLVLNIINYMEEYKKTFEESSLWTKNQTLLILFYEHIEKISRENFIIKYAILHQFTENDLRIIKNDWKTIIDKIKAGKAHEISEGDTYYLGACTKGANSESLRQQPFSPIMAKQRAFSLKTTYMTQIVRELTSNTKKEDSLFDYIDLIEDSIEDSILKKMSPYFGMSERELLGLFGIESTAKNKFELITNKILGIKRNLSSTPEFKKANIKVKTIRVSSNDTIRESMSFPAFKYEDLVKEIWEESSIRLMFETTKFLFIVFREMNGEFHFDDVIFWNMPITHIETNVKKVWEKTVDVVKHGNIVSGYKKNGDRKTNFPSTKFDSVCHVRPHGINKKDVYPLPIQDQYTGSTVYTKHCFWLNNTYVLSIINRAKENSELNNELEA